MTTFQDPPPHSRRAVRQSERGENPDAQVNFVPFEGHQPAAPAGNVDENPEHEPFAGPAPTGRRARAAAPEESAEVASTPPQPEPLTYATQGGATSSTGADQWAEPSPHAQQPEQAYRVRDFSPEGRRSAGIPQPQPWATTPESRASDVAAPLEYRTQAAPPTPPAPAQQTTPPAQVTTPPAQVTTPPAQVTTPPSAFLPPSAQPPQVPVHAVPVSPSPEPQTMSRRELRALLAQQEAAAAQAASGVPPLVEPEAPTSANSLSNAMAEFEALTRSTRPAVAEETPGDDASAGLAAEDERARAESAEREAAEEARQREEQQAVDQRAHEQQLAVQQAAEEQQAASERAAHDEAAELDSHAAAVAQAELKAEEERQEIARRAQEADTARAEALHAASLESERLAAEAAAHLTPQFVEPEVAEQPFSSAAGHWSRQGELDDETQPYENTLSRQVGGSNIATTTSALVLPVIPAPDFSTAIGNTGDILVTGSIDLPRSLGTTGGDARRYDDPDVDNLFDAFDNEIINTDSAPVRAIRAVSTHTSTHGVLANAQPKTSRMLPILLGTTIVLAVAVVTVLVVAFVNGVF